MSSLDQAYSTQLKNIQTKTGQTLDQLYAFIQKSKLAKHSEVRAMLKRDLGLSYGDANMLALHYFKSNQQTPSGDPLDEIYSGAKADLRPIHDKLMSAINKLGEFEIAPKKGYLSLRRKKQFAMIGPATQARIEVGLNMKGVKPTVRLIAQPAGGMCQYKVYVLTAKEVDKEIIGWIKQAYDSAG
jgi:hypothetical protein